MVKYFICVFVVNLSGIKGIVVLLFERAFKLFKFVLWHVAAFLQHHLRVFVHFLF